MTSERFSQFITPEENADVAAGLVEAIRLMPAPKRKRAPEPSISQDAPPEEPTEFSEQFTQAAGLYGEAPAAHVWKPLSDRNELTLAAWLERPIPKRDYLLGTILCTTSRWLVTGETGVGKTLLIFELMAAVSSGKDFLEWKGRRKCRIMYLDGEMPQETFKERTQLIAKLYGKDIEFFGYCREVLSEDEMPPFGTENGQAWLMREIETVKPDIIVFDSIMCLTDGEMSEASSWEPIKPLVRKLSRKRIAQIWMHHTGHDTTKAFGTKTREWEMDTHIILTKNEDMSEDNAFTPFTLEFKKARHRTDKSYGEYAKLVITRDANGFKSAKDKGTKSGKDKRDLSAIDALRRHYEDTYHRLANDVVTSPGHNGKSVRKVSVNLIRDELKSRGHLETKDDGTITPGATSLLNKVKCRLLDRDYQEQDKFIWKA